MQDTSYSIMSRIGVFGLARNNVATGITPQFSHQEWRARDHTRPWSAELAERLPPGGAIVVFWHFEGGPLELCNFVRDTVGESLASVVDTLRAGFAGSRPFLSFCKWGDDWEIDVLARNVTSKDSLAIRNLLRSIVFESTPVVTEGQAAQLAYQALPPEVRMSGDACRDFQVDVTEAGGLFEALFRSCRTCGCAAQPVEAMEGEWRYRVHANGAVEAVGG